ncbi:MAG TPA: AraC family ligand binding domain-containing protein [Streptosporangiaceae bacterium]|jgi:AraC-like DNA-binding protein
MGERIGRDWSRYSRAADRPVEAMYAGFRRHTYDRHSHDAYSIGVTELGAQAFRCRGAARTSAAGMVMAFNPDEPHDGYPATADGFIYRIVHIAPDLVADVLGDAAGPGGGAGLPLFTEPVVTDPRLAAAVRRLNAALLGGADPLTRDERLSEVVLAMAATTVRPSDPAARVSRRAVARVRDALADHVRAEVRAGGGAGGALDADALAAVAGCSRHALYRAFQRVYGMSPSAYQRQLRLREARGLLRRGIPIADAAACAGFADQAHLTRWFVRCYGITPAVYVRA